MLCLADVIILHVIMIVLVPTSVLYRTVLYGRYSSEYSSPQCSNQSVSFNLVSMHQLFLNCCWLRII